MTSIEEKLRNGVKESLKQRFKERRSNLEIMADILSAARSGAVKTEIVYKANLNFTRLKGYLAYLETRGLLENSGPLYKPTVRGKEFLCEYQMMTDMFHGPSRTGEKGVSGAECKDTYAMSMHESVNTVIGGQKNDGR